MTTQRDILYSKYVAGSMTCIFLIGFMQNVNFENIQLNNTSAMVLVPPHHERSNQSVLHLEVWNDNNTPPY